MGVVERIARARAFEAGRFVAFEIDGVAAGHVRRDLAEHLNAFPDVFVAGSRIRFRASLSDSERRSAAMADVARRLAAEGLLSPWRDELYAIGAPSSAMPWFHLERSAVRFFGFAARAVHVNGLSAGGRSMWIAQRSADKAIDPGMYDNLVGGGVAAGLSVAQTLVKEAWEEAGIDPALAATATFAGRLQVLREVREGLHAETIEAYDLMLPDDFGPANQDGEVAGFRSLTLAEVAGELESDAPYTADAALVAIDCLARRGVIDAHLPDPARIQ
jgi:8-oxo-dGTP pyrophosphatase MutT (NUDIX family)